MSPQERITQGLLLVHEGLAELREEDERARVAAEARRALMVNTEEHLGSLRVHAMAARRTRHLRPGELSGPQRPARDRLPASDRGAIVVTSSVDEKTQACLVRMGLVPQPRVVRKEERGLLARLLK